MIQYFISNNSPDTDVYCYRADRSEVASDNLEAIKTPIEYFIANEEEFHEFAHEIGINWKIPIYLSNIPAGFDFSSFSSRWEGLHFGSIEQFDMIQRGQLIRSIPIDHYRGFNECEFYKTEYVMCVTIYTLGVVLPRIAGMATPNDYDKGKLAKYTIPIINCDILMADDHENYSDNLYADCRMDGSTGEISRLNDHFGHRAEWMRWCAVLARL